LCVVACSSVQDGGRSYPESRTKLDARIWIPGSPLRRPAGMTD
jgi:hypothetical protein